jgi:hypothetical protein
VSLRERLGGRLPAFQFALGSTNEPVIKYFFDCTSVRKVLFLCKRTCAGARPQNACSMPGGRRAHRWPASPAGFTEAPAVEAAGSSESTCQRTGRG